jgi:hypothetical protein
MNISICNLDFKNTHYDFYNFKFCEGFRLNICGEKYYYLLNLYNVNGNSGVELMLIEYCINECWLETIYLLLIWCWIIFFKNNFQVKPHIKVGAIKNIIDKTFGDNYKLE